MSQIDKIINLALKKDLKAKTLEKTLTCPNESELVDYISNSVSRKRRNEIDTHLQDCMACMEDIVLAQKISTSHDKNLPGVGKGLKTWLKKNVFLLLSILTFALSFLLSHYFVQLLVATLILAGKWIFDTVNARILIMIYDAWKKGGESEVRRVMERFNSRNIFN